MLNKNVGNFHENRQKIVKIVENSVKIVEITIKIGKNIVEVINKSQIYDTNCKIVAVCILKNDKRDEKL